MKFVLLNGPSCAGKSTVVQRVLKEKDRFYSLSFDVQKWSFSKFDRNNHFEDVRKVLTSLAETACAMQYNVVCDSALYRGPREELLEIPRRHGYEIVEINLEVEYDVLAKRFDERIAEALANPDKPIANVSKERFKEIYDIYHREKNPSAITFRTDSPDSEVAMESILELL